MRIVVSRARPSCPRHGLFLLSLTLSLLAACRPPYAVLTVNDPFGAAPDATHLEVSRAGGGVHDLALGTPPFPVDVTLLAASVDVTLAITVIARDADGLRLAVGRSVVTFPASGGRGSIDLLFGCEPEGTNGKPCATDEVGVRGLCVDHGCGPSRCGDGWVDTASSETCDDANADDTDACLNDCTLARCGDGIVRADITDPADPTLEECDLGAQNDDADACTSDCRRNRCGDGLLWPGVEECELVVPLTAADYADLTTVNHGDCVVVAQGGDFLCRTARCGDGFVRTGVEACDDGNTVGGDGCSAGCDKIEHCGDAVIDEGELCDDGNANPNDGCDQCRSVSWIPSVVIGNPNGNGEPLAMEVSTPQGLAIDTNGDLYVSTGDNTVVRYSPAQTSPPRPAAVVSIAGTGQPGDLGNGGPATAAQLWAPHGLAFDQLGNLFIADTNNGRIRQVTAAGTMELILPATYVIELALEPDGNLLFCSNGGQLLRQPLVDGKLAGGIPDPVPGAPSACQGLATDARGTTVVAALSGSSDLISWKPAGTTTWSTSGTAGSCIFNMACGDGGPLSAATFGFITALATSDDGDVYVASIGLPRVRRIAARPDTRVIDATSLVTTVLGMSTACNPSNDPTCGDGLAPTDATLVTPSAVAVSRDGELYVADAGTHKVRRVDLAATTPVAETVLGTGVRALDPQRRALAVQLMQPSALEALASGELAFGDTGTYVIGGAFPAGQARRLAGNGNLCPGSACLHGGPVTTTPIEPPVDLAESPDGTLYFLTSYSSYNAILRLRGGTLEKLDIGGLIPNGIAFLADGTLLVSDWGTHTIQALAADVDGVLPLTPAISWFAGVPCSGDPDACWNASSHSIPIDITRAATPLGQPTRMSVWVNPADPTSGTVWLIDASWKGIFRISYSAGLPEDDWADALVVCGAITPPTCTSPQGIAAVSDGDAVFVDNAQVLAILSYRWGFTVLGGGMRVHDGDRGPIAGARFDTLVDVTARAGVFYVLEKSGYIRALSNVLAGGTVDTVAGPVFPGDGPLGAWPDGVARLASPNDLERTDAGWFLSDNGPGRIREVDPALGELTTVAGHPFPGNPPTPNAARFAPYLEDPDGMAFDATGGVLYVLERQANRILALDVAAGTLTHFAGDTGGAAGTADGDLLTARFDHPADLSLDAGGRVLWVADTGNHVIRRIDLVDPPGDPLTAEVTTVVGVPGTSGFMPLDGGPAYATYLDGPTGVLWTDAGGLFISDRNNHRVLRLDAGGDVEVVLGRDRVPSSLGSGAPAASLPVDSPGRMALDSFGNLFVAGPTAVRVVTAGTTGAADGSSRVFSIYGEGATGATLVGADRCLSGIVVSSASGDGDRVDLVDCGGTWLRLDRQRD